jgi:hypothetical protein
MPDKRQKNCVFDKKVNFRLRRLPVLLAALFVCEIAVADKELWVENPVDVAFAVGNMTQGAKDMGLTDDGFTEILISSLKRGGLVARPSDFERDHDMLFLDIVVEHETYYASLGFWRLVSYRLPDGELNSEIVTVWQDYSVGAHHNNPARVRDTVTKVIERFVAKYSDVNDVQTPLRVASGP